MTNVESDVRAFVFAVDIGGTFTDLVACDMNTGAVTYAKSPTTYEDFGHGIFDCIRKAAVRPSDAVFVKHGTTLVINALLQRAGARTALLTTRGFRDVLEIGRGNRTQPFNLRFRRDAALVPREWRFEAEERMEASGKVRLPLDGAGLERLAAELKRENIEALAISFVNAYANPEHENQAAAILGRLMPELFISTGTGLSREWYEFERTATVAANAYVGPQASQYIGRFDERLREGGFEGALMLMGSHGGVLSAERIRREPIALVESGPVGGCIGAAAYALPLQANNLIAFDMGGTTAKCALVERGRYAVESTYHIGGIERGFPIRGNVIDIVEVGAGGGSIAYIDAQKRLHVGPRSAGSTPGPVCYGRGGAEPTVTDANLALGRLDAEHFLGGEMRLDAGLARDSLCSRIASPLGYQGDSAATEAARGILTIANLTMAGAIKQISVARGHDPRDFALFCYGGGGPLHGAELARELSIPRVIIPPEPGNFSAVGMLLADARLDTSRTFLAAFDETAVAQSDALYAAMESESRQALEQEFGKHPVQFERQAEIRYKGQKHSLKVALPAEGGAAALHATFNSEYRRRYGHANPQAKAEFVAVHCVAVLQIRHPRLSDLRIQAGRTPRAARTRAVYFLEQNRYLDTRIYDRYALAPGFSAAGPAMIEEYGSSTLVGPRDRFAIGNLGEIQIDCSA